VFGGGVPRDTFAEQVQLAFSFGDVSFATRQFLQPPVHQVLQTLDFASEIDALEIEAERLPRVAPTLGVFSDDGALWRALRQATFFPEINLAVQAGTDIAARIADERPAPRRGTAGRV
jgi:hypothetical protein